MAFVLKNGYDVEHASQMLVYENLFPKIQHINGKGVTDKYTKTDSVRNVNAIDVMRILPYAPRFRKTGSLNNGGWHNAKNVGGYNNAAQSTHYTIPVDLFYDEGVPIFDTQEYSNPDNLKAIVMAQLVDAITMSINVVTYAKQIEGFFRVGDNFAKSKTPSAKGTILAADITADELANAFYYGDPSAEATNANSMAKAFIKANASLTKGIPEIGAFVVPVKARQSFITVDFDTVMKGQYMTNASESATKILATGFINPFNGKESARITEDTLFAGMYDGVGMFILSDVILQWVEVALGILGTTDDGSASSEAGDDAADPDGLAYNRYLTRLALSAMRAMVVYGAGTCRGIVGPSIEVNKQPFQHGIFISPELKLGVEVLHGGTIKLVIDGGQGAASKFTADTIARIVNTITFTPIDGVTVTGANVFASGIYNDGSSN